jgi:hypothetical protein
VAVLQIRALFVKILHTWRLVSGARRMAERRRADASAGRAAARPRLRHSLTRGIDLPDALPL